METDPGQPVKTVWAYLTRAEAVELWDALNAWATEPGDPGWHCHIGGPEGSELTIAIGEPDDPTFADRFAKPS
jgi:hypothetical protein